MDPHETPHPLATHLRAILLGAWIGTASAALSSIPFGTFALPLSLPPGFFGGIALALLALHLRAGRWSRRLALLAAGPTAVFVSELLSVLTFGYLAGDRMDALGPFFLAGLATVLAVPGLVAGAFVFEAIVGRRTVEGVDATWRARRLARELRWVPSRHAGPALAALADPSHGVRLVAIRWLASYHDDPLAILTHHLSHAPEADVSSLARALETLALRKPADTAAVETALLDILERGDWHAQREALTRLGGIGSTRSLEPLASFQAIGYLASDAEAATRRIRRRLPNAQPGQLSPVHAADSSGALSTAPEAGSLSHVPFRPRQC